MNKTELGAVKKYLEDTYENIFPRNSGQFERHFKDTIELETSEELCRLVRESASLPPVPRILDIGCGFGTFVLVCRKKGYQAYGIDVAKFEVKFARRRLNSELPDCTDDAVYQLSSAESLPFEKESFDVVTLWNLLEHVPDYKEVLKEADRVLKPGAHLFLISPNYLSFREEAHYHLPWLPLMPKSLAKLYLRANGRDPSFLISNIFYLTNLGVLRWLHKKYNLTISEFKKVQNPDLCDSKSKANLLRKANSFKVGAVVKFLIYLTYINPFKKSITICARKKS